MQLRVWQRGKRTKMHLDGEAPFQTRIVRRMGFGLLHGEINQFEKALAVALFQLFGAADMLDRHGKPMHAAFRVEAFDQDEALFIITVDDRGRLISAQDAAKGTVGGGVGLGHGGCSSLGVGWLNWRDY